MWRIILIGWLALGLAEEVEKEEPEVSKRQAGRGSTLVYGAAPSQYSVPSHQTPHQTPQTQIPSEYQPQSEVYLISPNRKPVAQALTYANEGPRRPQYIQLSALQYQAAQQAASQQTAAHQAAQQAAQQAAHQQSVQQSIQQQHQITPAQYEALISQTEAGHGSFYRPGARLQQQPQHHHQLQVEQQQQPEGRGQPDSAPVQYAASAIVDSQAGSFERELAQLVAANRAQEQKYASAQPGLKKPAPQQYLKEVTRPVARPLSAGRLAAPSPIQYQHQQTTQQAAPLYRYIYQPDVQQLPAHAQYKQAPSSLDSSLYARPQVQQYIQAQPQSHLQQHQPQLQAVRLRGDDDTPVLRAHSQSHAPAHRPPTPEPPAPSRSTIYVSQSTPLKKPAYTALAALAAEQQTEDDSQKQVPVVRLPSQRQRPLTQEEFQQLLQSGSYTATLVPSDNPHSPHQEYLLHPTGQAQQRPIYPSEQKQEAQTVTYLLPQSQSPQHQRAVKRRPVYNIQA